MKLNRILTVASVSLLGCSGSPTTNMPPGSMPPGGELMPPAANQGLQLASPSFTLQPGEELFKCWYTTLPNDVEIAATKLQSQMTPGSHHFIVYTTSTAERPDGTFEDCSARQGAVSLANAPIWLYSTQDPTAELKMPDGVAMPLAAHQALYFDMHYINATTAPMTVQVKLNFDYATGTYQRAGAFVTYNTQIKIPAGGMQTVSGDCDVPSEANFFIMSTHSHKRTIGALAAKSVGGVMGDQIVKTTDWEHAGVSWFNAPTYLNFAAGEKLHYECTYKNDSSDVITVGESAAKNEMCMAIGYYFPAAGNAFCLNSLTLKN
jgi:hypothetical protein